MSAADVVEAVDVIKEGLGDESVGCPCVPPDEFSLQGFEEGLDGCIVLTVALAAHRYRKAQLLQSILIFMRTILASAICMMNAAWRRVSKRYGTV